jgi:hypothetical protein
MPQDEPLRPVHEFYPDLFICSDANDAARKLLSFV